MKLSKQSFFNYSVSIELVDTYKDRRLPGRNALSMFQTLYNLLYIIQYYL